MSVGNGDNYWKELHEKESKNLRTSIVVAWVIILLLTVSISILLGCVYKLNGEINNLNTQQQMQQELHSEQIATLSGDISTVRDDMQTQIDDQKEKLDKQKTIQHNTNQALIRANKQINEKESEIQELREELKK